MNIIDITFRYYRYKELTVCVTSDIFLAVTDPETKVLQELADCRQYCIEGLGEAEACGDIEMQAEFFLQGAVLNITEGKSLEHTLSLLQVCTNN